MRKMADCRRFESDNRCTLTIIGEDGPELREQIRVTLEPEDSYVMGSRTPEPFPG
jgi:hypothetical protein